MLWAAPARGTRALRLRTPGGGCPYGPYMRKRHLAIKAIGPLFQFIDLIAEWRLFEKHDFRAKFGCMTEKIVMLRGSRRRSDI
jgi:hypothetical protein